MFKTSDIKTKKLFSSNYESIKNILIKKLFFLQKRDDKLFFYVAYCIFTIQFDSILKIKLQ